MRLSSELSAGVRSSAVALIGVLTLSSAARLDAQDDGLAPAGAPDVVAEVGAPVRGDPEDRRVVVTLPEPPSVPTDSDARALSERAAAGDPAAVDPRLGTGGVGARGYRFMFALKVMFDDGAPPRACSATRVRFVGGFLLLTAAHCLRSSLDPSAPIVGVQVTSLAPRGGTTRFDSVYAGHGTRTHDCVQVVHHPEWTPSSAQGVELYETERALLEKLGAADWPTTGAVDVAGLLLGEVEYARGDRGVLATAPDVQQWITNTFGRTDYLTVESPTDHALTETALPQPSVTGWVFHFPCYKARRDQPYDLDQCEELIGTDVRLGRRFIRFGYGAPVREVAAKERYPHDERIRLHGTHGDSGSGLIIQRHPDDARLIEMAAAGTELLEGRLHLHGILTRFAWLGSNYEDAEPLYFYSYRTELERVQCAAYRAARGMPEPPFCVPYAADAGAAASR